MSLLTKMIIKKKDLIISLVIALLFFFEAKATSISTIAKVNNFSITNYDLLLEKRLTQYLTKNDISEFIKEEISV